MNIINSGNNIAGKSIAAAEKAMLTIASLNTSKRVYFDKYSEFLKSINTLNSAHEKNGVIKTQSLGEVAQAPDKTISDSLLNSMSIFEKNSRSVMGVGGHISGQDSKQKPIFLDRRLYEKVFDKNRVSSEVIRADYSSDSDIFKTKQNELSDARFTNALRNRKIFNAAEMNAYFEQKNKPEKKYKSKSVMQTPSRKNIDDANSKKNLGHATVNYENRKTMTGDDYIKSSAENKKKTAGLINMKDYLASENLASKVAKNTPDIATAATHEKRNTRENNYSDTEYFDLNGFDLKRFSSRDNYKSVIGGYANKTPENMSYSQSVLPKVFDDNKRTSANKEEKVSIQNSEKARSLVSSAMSLAANQSPITLYKNRGLNIGLNRGLNWGLDEGFNEVVMPSAYLNNDTKKSSAEKNAPKREVVNRINVQGNTFQGSGEVDCDKIAEQIGRKLLREIESSGSGLFA